MESEAEFSAQVKDAYEHLYDLLFLRSHPLLEVLLPQSAETSKERAWELHHLLINAVEDLNPGPRAPVLSREWRRHRLMVLRYLDGKDPDAVAAELSISRRHYYREHDTAVEALAAELWQRVLSKERIRSATVSSVRGAPSPEGPLDERANLLRQEAARIAASGQQSDIAEVLPSVTGLLQERMGQQGLTIDLSCPPALPAVGVDRVLLRQILVGILGYLVEQNHNTALSLHANVVEGGVQLDASLSLPSAGIAPMAENSADRVSSLEEMVRLGAGRLASTRAHGRLDLALWLPAYHRPTLLAVDDNADVLQLVQRYVQPYGYRVLTAQRGSEALELARREQPQVVTLDLMMPDQDGWDVLQTLLHQPETRDIPVIICSVLRQKELALTLGAAGFVAKPISEPEFLAALAPFLRP
jgi:CheY-like chemotaxis protein